MIELKGKVAVVTGGAMGIGFGIAKRFAEAGAKVLIADIDEAAAGQAAGKLMKMSEVYAMAADISKEGTGRAIVDECVKRFGRIDILVNNAGIFPQVPMLEMEGKLFDKVYQINLRGLAFTAKAAALQMIKQGGGGRIINISSIDALHPSMVGLAAYDASKGGVTMFTKSLALEVGKHGILVNAIAPGGIRTEGTAKPLEGSGMTEAQMKAMMEGFLKQIPLGRMGEPDDIAKAAAFLASDYADYITGETLVVDGGRLLS
jgi:2-deoxy-D-gluconate 3-dehydrogenase